MRILRLSSALILLIAGCAPPAPVTVPPIEDSKQVLFVSFDGVGYEALIAAADTLGAGGWNRVSREGVTARLIPVEPTLTSVTHISMATGAPPGRTGIVSNTLHMPGTPADDWASGFDVSIEHDTLWQAARRQGKRVGAITYPGVDGTTPERSADFGLIYTNPVSRSRIEAIERSAFQIDSGLHRQGSFSPILVARLSWAWRFQEREVSSPVELVALDTTDDDTENYDDFLVRHGETVYEVGPDRWFPLSAELDDGGKAHLFGGWSRILSFDPELETLSLYWGSISRNQGYPDSFRKMIDLEVGFWPGPPDDWGASRWLEAREGIDPETYLDQLERFSDFFTRATLIAKQRMAWDLMLAYQPIVDEAGHQWLLVSDDQKWGSPANQAAGALVRAEALRTFDSALSRLLDSAGKESIVVVSDHGMAPLDTAVRINGYLVDWGYATATDRGRMAADTRWSAYTSGGFAAFQQFGEVDLTERDELIARLRELQAPDGLPLFERVQPTGPEDHPRAGQIKAYLRPSLGFVSGTSGDRFMKTSYFGQHGYLSHHRDMHAIFGAWGSGIPKEFPPSIEQTALARWISGLLDIAPPAGAN